MYTNHRHYTLLILALGAIVISSMSYIFLYRAIESQSILAQETLKTLAIEDKKKQQEGDSASIYAKTTDERVRINTALLSQEKVVDFITATEKIGTDTNTQLELSSISDETIPNDTHFAYFKGRVTTRGSWANVMRALSLLEHMPYGISFDTVKIAESADSAAVSKDKKTSAKKWESTVDIRVLTAKK